MSIVPKTIIQTSLIKPDENYLSKLNKCISNDWKYLHFTDEEIYIFFNKNKLDEFPNIIEKFNSFRLGQHKADLFRYYYLYIYGGVYIDTDIMLYKNIEDIIKNYNFCSILSIKRYSVFQGFIAVEKKSLIMYEALKDAYNINLISLNKNYHLLTYNLYFILKKKI
jgi:mannosyltransferase OCH1-like enzyme